MSLLKDEYYVRVKLGQKIFPTPEVKDCENHRVIESKNCDNCKYNKWYYDEWKKNGHLRINFDAQDDSQAKHNKDIIDLFEKDFMNKKIVIVTIKGSGYACIVSNSSYNNYDFWKNHQEVFRYINDNYDIPFEYEKIIEISGETTVDIFVKLIKYCQRKKFIKNSTNKKE
jgi:hypothetical protein